MDETRRDRPSNARQDGGPDASGAAGSATGHTTERFSQPDQDERATGTVDNPTAPGEPQPGDRGEMAANLGGPVDVFPMRGPKPRRRARD